MYTPKHFASPDRESELQLIAHCPLASLVSHGARGLEANLIPMYWFDNGTELGVLRGHVARANPLWQLAGHPVLALFQAGNAYISPNYYPSKARDPRVVPTWNYSAVQVNGVLNVIESRDAVLQLLGEMTDQHERQQSQPWRLDDAPAAYIEKLLGAIVGIEIDISAIAGKFKQSQNQSAENQAGVRAALARG